MYTKENVEKLVAYFEKIKELKEPMTEAFSKAVEASKEKTFTVHRKGKDVEATGQHLWYEVQNLGADCEAGSVLKPLFPEVFDLSQKYNTTVNEMNAFCVKTFGINPEQMSIYDIFRIVIGINEQYK